MRPARTSLTDRRIALVVAIAGAIGSGVGKQLTLRTTLAIDSRFAVELAGARHHAGARRDSMMWRQDVDHGQKHELGGATLIGRLDIIGPITEGRVPINALA